MKNYNESVNQLYSQKEKEIILGLTGRTGSGCTTAASILKKNFDDLELEYDNVQEGFAKENREFEIIKNYNNSVDEKKQIAYTDIVGMLMSSVTDIINAISYILIAFVAISLIVSSIMIGIITHISVLERTKEIGILRALGASKHNISSVFNAETFIIGFCAGMIGVVLSEILIYPINSLIKKLADGIEVTARLPIRYSIILILISMFMTMIGGFIPAKRAAKKDPVIALRTE